MHKRTYHLPQGLDIRPQRGDQETSCHPRDDFKPIFAVASEVLDQLQDRRNKKTLITFMDFENNSGHAQLILRKIIKYKV